MKAMKEKTPDKSDITKIRTSCAENNTIKKMKADIKRQKGKVFTHYTFDKIIQNTQKTLTCKQ